MITQQSCGWLELRNFYFVTTYAPLPVAICYNFCTNYLTTRIPSPAKRCLSAF
jgi:hypothetical protein